MAKIKYIMPEPDTPPEKLVFVCGQCQKTECVRPVATEGYVCPVCGSTNCVPEVAVTES